jgi:CheY-like chemotaxis protein
MIRRDVRILLVEDDMVDVMSFRRGLAQKKVRHCLWVAQDGEYALSMLRGDQTAGPLPRPHLIVLDLNLPRMNGWELLAELRRDTRLRDSMVFVLTTSEDEVHRTAAYRWNVAGYMVKARVGRNFVCAIALLEHFWRLVELP